MHELVTLHLLNKRNAEAERILKAHSAEDELRKREFQEEVKESMKKLGIPTRD